MKKILVSAIVLTALSTLTGCATVQQQISQIQQPQAKQDTFVLIGTVKDIREYQEPIKQTEQKPNWLNNVVSAVSGTKQTQKTTNDMQELFILLTNGKYFSFPVEKQGQGFVVGQKVQISIDEKKKATVKAM